MKRKEKDDDESPSIKVGGRRTHNWPVGFMLSRTEMCECSYLLRERREEDNYGHDKTLHARINSLITITFLASSHLKSGIILFN